MEQPEIHLHPKAQALLADVMIDVINSKEDGEDRNIQLIIESHSEHFLTRLQRRIAEVAGEKPISSSKVSAYFAHFGRTMARLEPLDIDELGNIRNWPENFFGDTMADVVARTVAQSERLSSEGMPHD
jgi:predicted ATPase